ncbi:hypothetical protein BGZ58_002533 [Dissophora ornata]|nr:hypothetical protein BGZ58_002533 [Dissophora ornata]
MAANTLTIFCVISGEVASSAFPVKISSDETIGELKKAIIKENPNAFEHVDAKDLMLWRATVPTDENAGDEHIIRLDDLDDKTKLGNPRTSLSKHFPESPDDNTYIVVERPQAASTPHTLEVVALLEENARLRSTSISMAIVDKRGGNNKKICQYVADTKTATLEELRQLLGIHFEKFEGDKFMQIYLHQPGCATSVWLSDDDVLRSCLDIAKDKGHKSFTISLDSPAKIFSSFTWKDTQTHYGIGEARLIPEFDIQPKPLQDNEETTLEQVVQEIVRRRKAFLIDPGVSERTKSSIVESFMVGAMQSYDSQMYLSHEHPMSGMRGHGPVDYAVIDRRNNSQVLGVTEAKKEDYKQGMAQNMAQLDVAVQQKKRKRMDEVDEGSGERQPVCFKSYGIVTDSFKWILMECTLDEQDSLTYRRKTIPETLQLDVDQGDADLKADCEIVFSYILALLDLMKDEVVNRSTYGSPASGPLPNKRFATDRAGADRVSHEGDADGDPRTRAAAQETATATHQA